MVKVLKENSIIKGMDVTDQFYGRILSLLFLVANPEELVTMKQEDPKGFTNAVEPLYILLATLQELAENQELVQEIETLENPLPGVPPLK